MEDLVIPLHLDTARARDELGRFVGSGKKAGEEIKAGADMASDGYAGLASAMRMVNIESAALQVAGQMIGAMSAATMEASREMKQLAMDFIGLRDRARELAGIMGSKTTSQFTTEQLQFAAATGMTGDDALKFRAAFQGEAQQYKGRFAPGQFEEFEKTSAQYAQQMGLGANEAAKLAGNVIRSGPMEGATSSDLTKTLGQAFKIVQGGSGDNPILAKQLAETNASMVGEGQAFGNIQDAAIGVRMMAEGNQSEAFTSLQAMMRGLTGLASGKHRPGKPAMGEKLGIDFDTDLLEGVAKLDEAQASSGKGMQQFLSEIFANQHERQGFGMAIKARRGGVEKAAKADAATVGPGDVEAGVQDYLTDQEGPGALNVSKAKLALEESRLAQDRVRIETLKTDARTDMRELELDPRMRTMNKMLDMTIPGIGVQPFRAAQGMMGQGYQGDEQLEYARMLGLGKERAQAAGVDPSAAGPVPSIVTSSQKDVEHYLSRLVELTEQAQKKPLVVPPPAAGGARP